MEMWRESSETTRVVWKSNEKVLKDVGKKDYNEIHIREEIEMNRTPTICQEYLWTKDPGEKK
jgi:hypothetical protein